MEGDGVGGSKEGVSSELYNREFRLPITQKPQPIRMSQSVFCAKKLNSGRHVFRTN